MARIYLQGAIGNVFVGPTGHQHLRTIPINDEIPTVIDCPMCEKYLVKDFGGVYDPRSVPLTDRQIEDRERAKEDGDFAVAKAAQELARGALEVSKAKRARRAANEG
jgi:hypothetical protein